MSTGDVMYYVIEWCMVLYIIVW